MTDVIPIHDQIAMLIPRDRPEAVSVRVVVPLTVVDAPVAEAALMLAPIVYPDMTFGPVLHVEQVSPTEYNVDVKVE